MKLNYIYYENLTAVKLCRLRCKRDLCIPAEFELLRVPVANSANLIIVDDPRCLFYELARY